MTGETFTAEDMGEMRRQGDMRAFIRQQYRPTNQPAPEQPQVDPRPGHIVGAWPIGTTTSSTAGTICPCPSCAQLHHNPRPANFDPLA